MAPPHLPMGMVAIRNGWVWLVLMSEDIRPFPYCIAFVTVGKRVEAGRPWKCLAPAGRALPLSETRHIHWNQVLGGKIAPWCLLDAFAFDTPLQNAAIFSHGHRPVHLQCAATGAAKRQPEAPPEMDSM